VGHFRRLVVIREPDIARLGRHISDGPTAVIPGNAIIEQKLRLCVV
jgi:hypothetical protein